MLISEALTNVNKRFFKDKGICKGSRLVDAFLFLGDGTDQANLTVHIHSQDKLIQRATFSDLLV